MRENGPTAGEKQRALEHYSALADEAATLRLTEAAPDMFAVLHEMFVDGPVQVAFAGNPNAIASLEARVRAAIAKATAK